MRKFVFALCLLCTLGLLTACGDDVAEDTNQSAEGKAVTAEVGGPFTDSEFKDFLKVLPSIPGLTAQNLQDMEGTADGAAFSARIQTAIEDAGWDEVRFMYVYSHSMAVLNVEQMNQMTARMTAQMEDMPAAQKEMMEQVLTKQMGGQIEVLTAEMDKQVPASEQAVIRDNMDELYAVSGIPKQQ